MSGRRPSTGFYFPSGSLHNVPWNKNPSSITLPFDLFNEENDGELYSEKKQLDRTKT